MSVIFDSAAGNNFTIGVYLICLVVAGLCGVIAAYAASFRTHVSKSFIISLVLLPMIVETVIVMVNGNVGTGVAVMGAFSLVRFRSVAGKAKDIAAIFLAMTAGLACAAGYIVIALLFTIIVSAVMLLLAVILKGKSGTMELHITVPESLRFAHEFDDLFEKYTKNHRLVKTKTSNMGSLYKLLYKVEMKNPDEAQEFIDNLRCRNGNLEIAIAEEVEGSDEL